MGKDHIPRFDCDAARGLLPGYLDGELSEPQAAPLREHLLACVSCRSGAIDQKNVTRWFEAAPVAVPDGFAARVARRAFAGDPGTVSVSQATAALSGDGSSIGATAQFEPEETPIYELLPFVLKLTAVAAVLLFSLSLFLRGTALPENRDLQAYDSIPPWELDRQEAESALRPDLPALSVDEAKKAAAEALDSPPNSLLGRSSK